jgi:hypothetical protein
MPKRAIDESSQSCPPARVTLRHAVTSGHAPAGEARVLRLAGVPTVSGDDCARSLARCGMVRWRETPGCLGAEHGLAPSGSSRSRSRSTTFAPRF